MRPSKTMLIFETDVGGLYFIILSLSLSPSFPPSRLILLFLLLLLLSSCSSFFTFHLLHSSYHLPPSFFLSFFLSCFFLITGRDKVQGGDGQKSLGPHATDGGSQRLFDAGSKGCHTLGVMQLENGKKQVRTM